MGATKRKPKDGLRLAVQVLFFLVIATIAVNHALEESGTAIPVLSSASTHALCPFGGVVSVYQYVDSGTMVRKVHESAFVLMWISFGLTVLLGPVFCGWVCPFGSFQEWLGRLGARMFRRKFNRFIPSRYDRYLRYLRYLVLAWVLYMTGKSAGLVFQDYDPYFALFNLWTGEVAVSGMVILAMVAVLSLFVERPFCKYACPYGAVLGVLNLVRIFKVRRNTDTCISCGACDRACPMNIRVSGTGTVRDHQCITCLKCTSEQACPVDETVELTVSRLGRSDLAAETAASGSTAEKGGAR